MPGLVVFGITGRMGQSLVRALREAQGAQATLSLCGAVASSASSALGQDAALEGDPTGVVITADPGASLKAAAVAVDFSLPQCVAANVRACALVGVPILVGTTGFDAATRGILERTAKDIPVLIAPNTSVGVSVVSKLVSMEASGLGPSYDVEIFEAHHRMKRDAPSGTALALGEAVAGARGRALEEVAVYDRAGQSRRHRGGPHGDLCGPGRAGGNHAPRHGPNHLRAGRPAGGRMADRAACGPVRHAERSRTLEEAWIQA